MIAGSELGFGINITLNNHVSNPANQVKQDFNSMVGSMDSGANKMTRSLNLWNNLSYAMEGVQSVMNGFETVGSNYDASMKDLSAVTGVTGKELDNLGSKARKSLLEFGGSAASNVEGFTRILSDLGPDIAKTPLALNSMSNTVQNLAKTMKGDVVGATNALDGSMLQFGVDLSNPIQAAKEMAQMANVMAAGAKAGNVEVTDVAGSVKVSGLVAHNAGLSFEEMNASLQVFGTGMLKSGEAGTAFRNILLKMQTVDALPKEAIIQMHKYGVNMNLVKDTTIPFGDRLRELSKISEDTTALTKVFGAENVTAASKILQSIPAYEDMKSKVTGTNTAFEMASTIMSSYPEILSRIKARTEDFAISVFNATKSALPFIQTAMMGATVMVNMGPAFDMVKSGAISLKIPLLMAAIQSGGLSGGLIFLQGSLMGTASAAWAAIAPLIPFIAIAAAIIAPIVLAYKSIKAFNDVMDGTDEPASGFLGWMQKLGGTISGVMQILSSWNGQTFTMSKQMNESLQKMGILEFVLNLGTWAVRIKELIGGMVDGFKTAFSPIIQMFFGLWKAVTPVRDIFNYWFSDMEKNTSNINAWVQIGKALGLVLGAVLIPILISTTLGFFAMAAGVIAATWPFIAVGVAIYGIVAAIQNWGVITDWLMEKWNGLIEWFSGLGQYFSELGNSVVDSFLGGIMSAWETLKQALLGLLSDLPGGELIMATLGIGGNSGQVQPSQGAFQGLQPQMIGQTMAETKGIESQRSKPAIFDRSSTKTENITIPISIDGEVITKVVNVNNELRDARRNE